MVSSTPRSHFTPGKDPVSIVQEAGWAPGLVWTGEISRPHRDSIPDHPARSQSLYRLSYPAHTCIEIQVQNHFKRCNKIPREWKVSYSIKRFRELISIFTKSHHEVLSVLSSRQFSLLSTNCSKISGRQPHQGVNVLQSFRDGVFP